MDEMYKLMIIVSTKVGRRTHIQKYPLTQPGLHEAEAVFSDAASRDYVLGVRLFRQDRVGLYELRRYEKRDPNGKG